MDITASAWALKYAEPVAVLTFNRPPYNMMSYSALDELNRLLDEVENKPGITAVILQSALDDIFIAHADVEDVMRLEQGLPPVGDPAAWDRVTVRLGAMRQITVAAVDGQAWGGGCELALACTFRVISNKAHFRLLEISKGAIPGAGGTQRLPRLIGVSRAAYMIMSCKAVGAGEALDIGLADALFDYDFSKNAMEWTMTMAEMPPHALAGAKEAIYKGIDMTLHQGLEHEGRIFRTLVSSPETKALGEKTVEIKQHR